MFFCFLARLTAARNASFSSCEIFPFSMFFPSSEASLENISFKIQPGENVAIVGETGGGKTTLLKLLMGFYEASSGTIFIGGKDVTGLDVREYRKYFSVVTQDSWLYNSSVMKNILYGNLNASEENVIQTIRFLGVESFIKTLPDSYNTIIEENASNLSEGQKQIVSIARAIISERPILVLDEATSSIDTSLESCLQNSLSKIFQKKTSIVVAHRLSTIRKADMILVIKAGRLEEFGKHEELISKRGIYYDMYSKTLK